MYGGLKEAYSRCEGHDANRPFVCYCSRKDYLGFSHSPNVTFQHVEYDLGGKSCFCRLDYHESVLFHGSQVTFLGAVFSFGCGRDKLRRCQCLSRRSWH